MSKNYDIDTIMRIAGAFEKTWILNEATGMPKFHGLLQKATEQEIVKFFHLKIKKH